MNKYLIIEYLTITYSLSSHHHGHHHLHIHLPASTTLDKADKEKWGKEEGKGKKGWLCQHAAVCSNWKK